MYGRVIRSYVSWSFVPEPALELHSPDHFAKFRAWTGYEDNGEGMVKDAACTLCAVGELGMR